MHYKMQANPVFDGVRTAGSPPVGGFIEGFVEGFQNSALAEFDGWAFDLPDTGFFFPGDVIHYYFEATFLRDGDPVSVRYPEDLTGFDRFPGDADYVPMQYPLAVRALPALPEPTYADQPPILFWNDAERAENWNEWAYSLLALGLVEGTDFDVYITGSPQEGLGNGLGGRATMDLIHGYETILYTSGDQWQNTITPAEYPGDAGDDVGLLDSWLQTGWKHLLLFGSQLASDLSSSGAPTAMFLADWLSVQLISEDIYPLIADQTTPTLQTGWSGMVSAHDLLLLARDEWCRRLHDTGGRVAARVYMYVLQAGEHRSVEKIALIK
jgi:hypothetical protein